VTAAGQGCLIYNEGARLSRLGKGEKDRKFAHVSINATTWLNISIRPVVRTETVLLDDCYQQLNVVEHRCGQPKPPQLNSHAVSKSFRERGIKKLVPNLNFSQIIPAPMIFPISDFAQSLDSDSTKIGGKHEVEVQRNEAPGFLLVVQDCNDFHLWRIAS
jgi:hypothetical protein